MKDDTTMKTSIGCIWKFLLIIGISGLLTFVGEASTLLGNSSTVQAASLCPSGYHHSRRAQNSCLPNAAYYCPQQGQVWSPNDNRCISEATNTNVCNPGLTRQDPDNAQQCIPINQPCGSASRYDPASGYCIVQPPKPIS